MTSTFLGRVETRLFVVVTVGLLWTLIVTPFLPLPPGNDRFTITVRTLAWVAIYLFLQGPMRVPFLRWRFRGGRIL